MRLFIRLIILALAAVTVMTGCQKRGSENGSGEDTVLDPDAVVDVMYTDNFALTNKQFTYFYMSAYSAYEPYASDLGFSTDAPLDGQLCSRTNIEGYTWHDFFLDETKKSAKELLVMCEEAKARGLTLSDEEIANIEQNVQALYTAADNQELTFYELVEQNYGSGVTEDDIRYCMELQLLASKTIDTIKAEPVYTDEQLLFECEDNKSMYYSADYRYYEFYAEYDSESKTSEIAEAKAEAKAAADALLAGTGDEATFLDGVQQYLRAESGMTEEEIAEELDATLVEGYAYNKAGDFTEWVFEQDEDGNFIRRADDVEHFYDETNGSYTVCVMVSPVHRAETPTRSVRHILISVDSFDQANGLPDAEARSAAEELLTALEADGITDEEFAQAAVEHSMDSGSASSGGLYENVGKGKMVEEFDTWLFDGARSVADTGIVLTEYGYHIMYYVGEGPVEWKLIAEDNLRAADYNKTYDKLFETHTVNVYELGFTIVQSA